MRIFKFLLICTVLVSALSMVTNALGDETPAAVSADTPRTGPIIGPDYQANPPSSATALLSDVRNYYKEGSYAWALVACQEFEKRYANDANRPEADLTAVRCMLNLGQYEPALKSLNDYLEMKTVKGTDWACQGIDLYINLYTSGSEVYDYYSFMYYIYGLNSEYYYDYHHPKTDKKRYELLEKAKEIYSTMMKKSEDKTRLHYADRLVQNYMLMYDYLDLNPNDEDQVKAFNNRLEYMQKVAKLEMSEEMASLMEYLRGKLYFDYYAPTTDDWQSSAETDYNGYQQKQRIALAESIWGALAEPGPNLPGNAMAILSLTNLDVGYYNNPASAIERLQYLVDNMNMNKDFRDYYQGIIDHMKEPSLGIINSSVDYFASPQVSLEFAVKIYPQVNFKLYPVDPNKLNEIFDQFSMVDTPHSKQELREKGEVITPEMLVELKGTPQSVEGMPGVTKAIRTWTVDTNATADGAPTTISASLEDLTPGMYVIEARADDAVTRCLVMVSPVMLLSSYDDRSMLLQAINAKDGSITKINGGNLYRYWSETDEKGYSVEKSEKLSSIPAKMQDDGWMFNMDKLKREGNYFLAVETEAGPALYSFYSPYYRAGDQYEVGILYTQKPLYRPEETVSFKGVLREVDYVEKVFSPVKNQKVKLTLYNPSYEEIWKGESSTNDFGSFWGEVKLPEGTMLGSLSLVAEWSTGKDQNYSTYAYFQLEEYEKPEYEMVVTPEKDRYLSGETVKIDVVGNYYFGAAMADSRVEYDVTRSGYNKKGEWEELLKKKGDGTTDKEGKFLITFDSDNAAELDNNYYVHVKLTDPSNHIIEQWAYVYTYRSDRYASLSLDKYTYHQGESMEAAVYTYDWYSNPVSLPVTVNVYRQSYDPTSYTYNKEELLYTDELTTGADGYGKTEITLTEPPQYVQVDAVIEDTQGTEVVSTYSVEFIPFTEITEETMPELDLSVDNYYPELNDQITLSIKSRFEGGTVYLAYLSNYMVETQKVELKPAEKGSSLDIVLDVSQKFLPAAEIYGTLVKDETIYRDYEYIYVTNTNTEMKVKVESDGKEYQPGEEAKLTVTCTDHNDQPIKSELSLVAIDNSLLALAPDQTYYLPSSMSGSLNRYVYLTQEDNTYMRGTLDSIVFYFQYFYPLSGSGSSYLPISRDWDIAGKMLDQIYVSYYISPELSPIINLSGTDYLTYTGYRTTTSTFDKLMGYGYGYGEGEDRAMGSGGGDEYYAEEAPAPPMSMGETKKEKTVYKPSAITAGITSEKDYLAADGTNEVSIGGKSYVQAILRQFFTDSPLWIPNLVTDSNGKATANVVVPDNLTTWELFALGVDKGQHIGWGSSSFVSAKNVIIRLKVPRCLVVGDSCKLTAMAHNYLTTEKEVRLSVETEGLTYLSGDQSKVIKVAANDMGIMEEWVRADKPGQVTLISAALTDEESDAAQTTLPVFPHGAQLKQSFAGRLRDSVTQTLTLADKIDPTTFKGQLILSPSLAKSISHGLEFFTYYPYDCIEQTINRFLPNALLATSAGQLGLDKSKLSEGLSASIDDGIKKLHQAQTEKGGWAWWKGGADSTYMTAYAVDALYAIKDSPFLTPESKKKLDEMYPKAESYLEGWLQELSNDYTHYDWELGLYVADVALRVGIGDEYLPLIRDSVEYYYENRDPLSDMGLVLLASALYQLGDDMELATVLRNMDNTANYGRDQTLWWGNAPDQCWYWWNDSVETTAKVLSLKMEVEPESKQIPFLVDWLVDQRRGAVWKSTKDSSSAMKAIMDYLLKYPEVTKPIIADYTLNQTKVGGLELNPKDFENPDRTIDFKLEDFVTGDNTLKVERTEGEGPVFYTMSVEYYTTADYIPAVQGSIKLERNYYLINRYYDNGKLVEERQPFEGEIKVGDELEVELVVNSPYDFDYVILEDPRPAGLIFTETDSYYDWWLNAFVELRTEKRAFLFERLNAGETKITYRLRAEVPGTFSSLPTVITGMYSPDIGSSTAELKVKVVE